VDVVCGVFWSCVYGEFGGWLGVFFAISSAVVG